MYNNNNINNKNNNNNNNNNIKNQMIEGTEGMLPKWAKINWPEINEKDLAWLLIL